jgi:hypothetical protein
LSALLQMQGCCPHRDSPSSPRKLAAGILGTKSFQEMVCAFGTPTVPANCSFAIATVFAQKLYRARLPCVLPSTIAAFWVGDHRLVAIYHSQQPAGTAPPQYSRLFWADNSNLLVACILAAITAPVECSALRADAVRSICIALQRSVLIVARIWIVWSLILTIRVGYLRTVSRFRDHLLCHYRGSKRYKQNCSCT